MGPTVDAVEKIARLCGGSGIDLPADMSLSPEPSTRAENRRTGSSPSTVRGDWLINR